MFGSFWRDSLADSLVKDERWEHSIDKRFFDFFVLVRALFLQEREWEKESQWEIRNILNELLVLDNYQCTSSSIMIMHLLSHQYKLLSCSYLLGLDESGDEDSLEAAARFLFPLGILIYYSIRCLVSLECVILLEE